MRHYIFLLIRRCTITNKKQICNQNIINNGFCYQIYGELYIFSTYSSFFSSSFLRRKKRNPVETWRFYDVSQMVGLCTISIRMSGREWNLWLAALEFSPLLNCHSKGRIHNNHTHRCMDGGLRRSMAVISPCFSNISTRERCNENLKNKRFTLLFWTDLSPGTLCSADWVLYIFYTLVCTFVQWRQKIYPVVTWDIGLSNITVLNLGQQQVLRLITWLTLR